MYEVEQKFIDTDGEFISFLKTLTSDSEKKTQDTYYDIKNSWRLFSDGIFIRIRTEKGASQLDFKFSTPEIATGNEHNVCIEKTFSIYAYS